MRSGIQIHAKSFKLQVLHRVKYTMFVHHVVFKFDERFRKIYIYNVVCVLYFYTDLETFLGRGIKQLETSHYIIYLPFHQRLCV